MAATHSTQSRRVKLTRAVVEGAKSAEKYYELRDTEIQGFVLRIEPTGSKRWKLRRGKRTISLGRFPDLPLSAARERAKAAARGQWPPTAPESEPTTTTWGDYLESDYLPWCEVHHRGAAKNAYRLRAMPFGELPFDQITPAVVERWRTGRKANGRATTTVNRDCASLRAALEHAVTMELIGVNPMARLKPLRTDKAGGIVRFLDYDEERRLYAELERAEPFVRAFVTVALHTGVRRGDAFALTWGDIDLKDRRLTVRESGAKSGQTRHVPLNAVAAAALKRWRGDAVPLPTLPIFPRREFKRAWKTLLRRAGVEKFRFHDCRHHFASRLVQAGVPLNHVRDLLGHASLAMTLRYSHLAPQHTADAVALLEVPGRDA